MISPETAAHLESGCSLIVGTVGPDGEPHATRSWGLRVLPDEPSRVRVLLDASDAPILEDLARSGAIAVTGTDVPTLRSVQLKGHAISFEPATDADQDRALQFCDQLITAINATDGTPRHLIERLVPRRYIACVIAVDTLFDQTPGPRAGAPLPAEVQ